MVPSLNRTLVLLFLEIHMLAAQPAIKPVDTNTHPQGMPATNVEERLKRPPDVVDILVLDFFTTLNAVKYEHPAESSQIPQVNAYYNWSVNNVVKAKRFNLRTFIYNEYGFRHYFDSLTIKTEDNFRFRNNVQIQLRKNVSIQAGFDQRTQLWKKWDHRLDTAGQDVRYLFSDYYSPGYFTYAFGAGFNFLEGAVVYIGLAGGKITRVRNQRIFDERGARRLYGLEKGERRKVEWGFSIIVSVPPQLLSKHFGWEYSGSLFAPRTGLSRLRSYTLESTSVLHYMFLRHMRLSLRTQIQYDEAVQEKIFLANHLSLGFYLSNRL